MQYCPKLVILSLTLNRSARSLLGYGKRKTNDANITNKNLKTKFFKNIYQTY